MQNAISIGLVLWVFPALMVFAAMTDLVDRRISNRVCVALIGSYFVLALVQLTPPLVVAGHVGVAMLAFAIGFVVFALGQMGGGDVKLISASVLWFGPSAGALEYAVKISLIGAVVTIVFVLARLDSIQYMMASNPVTRPLAGRDPSGRDIPYGLAISSAALLGVPTLAGVYGIL